MRRRRGRNVDVMVDFHTWQLLKGAALSTLLGVSSELARSGQSDRVQAIRMSTQDRVARAGARSPSRSEEHTSELQSLMRISYAVFCLKKKKTKIKLMKIKTKNIYKIITTR